VEKEKNEDIITDKEIYEAKLKVRIFESLIDQIENR
jgi:hypothetical protein